MLCEASRHWASMNGPIRRFRRTVHGFGSHVEMKTVEFLEKLEDWHACAWCSAVSSKLSLMRCRHVICDLCTDENRVAINAYREITYTISCCGFAERYSPFQLEAGHPGGKRVRCINASCGCDFVGALSDLDEHLRKNCALYSTTCSKCGDAFAYKDLRNHYTACSGKQGVFLRAADARALLDNLGAACGKLELAVASAKPDHADALRDTVGRLSEQLARIQGQLDAGLPWHVIPSRILRKGE